MLSVILEGIRDVLGMLVLVALAFLLTLLLGM
jgi:hypothetical protein